MVEWMLNIMEQGGYVGVFALMLLENLFPPIPSELIMPLAGFHCARGGFDLAPTIIAGTLGSVAGAMPWYWGARALGEQRFDRFIARYGAWLTMDAADAERARAWFRSRGWIAVFLGRLAPGVRTLISAPAGLFRMPFLPFLALTTIGSAIWVSLLTASGYLLAEQYHLVEGWIDPVAAFVFAALALTYGLRVRAQLRARRKTT
jgi:membrane protein DedA with SNARE-associated domain